MKMRWRYRQAINPWRVIRMYLRNMLLDMNHTMVTFLEMYLQHWVSIAVFLPAEMVC